MSKVVAGSNYPHIAARVFDTPLLIENSKLVTILKVLGPRLGFEIEPRTIKAMEDDGVVAYQEPVGHLDGMLQTSTKFESRDEGHYVGNGVAVIPIIGTLVQRGDWMSAMSGMVAYSQIERMVSAAVADRDVSEILLEIDSPGGEVAGAFDLADRLYGLRGEKKITAIAHEFAASAAYLIASTADEIIVPRTGAVGSIGVVAAHYDYSKAMEKRGVAVTFVYAGDKKVEGNPYQPLSEAAKKEWQDDIDGVYQLFVDTVSRNRNIGADRVRGTQAGMFAGFKAVDAGLVDKVNTFSNELSNSILRARNPGYTGQFFSQQTPQETTMSNVTEQEQKARAEAEAKAKAEQEAKAKAEAEAKAKAEADAKSKADVEAKAKQEAATNSTDQRARIKSITTCDEAKGREKLAQHFAFETDLTVEAAKASLAASPKASKLDDAMNNYKPDIQGQEVTEGERPKVASMTEVYDHRKAIFNKRAA